MDLLNLPLDDTKRIAELRSSYQRATPFPHIVLHDVVKLPGNAVIDAYPDLDWKGWTRAHQDDYQKGKRACRNIEQIPDVLRQLIYELEMPHVLKFLSAVTGKEALIPDPYLEGGGLHCSAQGGQLVPHTDFHLYDRLNLYRQLNLLLYLNPAWVPGNGGELQLFHKGQDQPVASIEPTFGTCVIFCTDDESVHGVSPISENSEPRKSVALYYYTSVENETYQRRRDYVLADPRREGPEQTRTGRASCVERPDPNGPLLLSLGTSNKSHSQESRQGGNLGRRVAIGVLVIAALHMRHAGAPLMRRANGCCGRLSGSTKAFRFGLGSGKRLSLHRRNDAGDGRSNRDLRSRSLGAIAMGK